MVPAEITVSTHQTRAELGVCKEACKEAESKSSKFEKQVVQLRGKVEACNEKNKRAGAELQLSQQACKEAKKACKEAESRSAKFEKQAAEVYAFFLVVVHLCCNAYEHI